METFCVLRWRSYLRGVNEPLALLLCQRGLIATPLTERLEALRYRVHPLGNPVELVTRAEQEQAMVVFADLDGEAQAVLQAIEHLRASPTTAHIPVIGFARELDDAGQAAAVARGATTAVPEAALLNHLPQLLQRVLEV